MVDYAEPSKVYRREERIARKEHLCDECGRRIEPGERYEFATGLSWDSGWWFVCKTCAHCIWAREWLNAQCDGFVHAGVREDLEEHWQEDPLLRDLDLGRRIVGARRKWKRKDGSLMPVPA